MSGIDRDALADLRRATNALALELPASVHEDYSRRLNAVLDLVQPADGIVLTRDEAALFARLLRNTGGRDDLAARIEGSA